MAADVLINCKGFDYVEEIDPCLHEKGFDYMCYFNLA